MKASGTLCEYNMVGCCLPTPKHRMLPLYRMRIFASNHAVAKSRFWYFCVSTEDDEEILGGNGLLWTGVRETSPVGEELQHLLHCDSHSDTHSRECWGLTTAGAVTHSYQDMGTGTEPGPTQSRS